MDEEKILSLEDTEQVVCICSETVKLAGDLFEMRCLSMDEWVRIRDYIREHENLQSLLSKHEPFLAFQAVSDPEQDNGNVTINLFLIYGLDEVEQIAFLDREDYLYEPPIHKDPQDVYWRPILRPLTKDQELDSTFEKENPTGTETSGGYVFVNGKPVGTTKTQQVVPLEIDDASTDLTITAEGSGDPIQWMVFGDILFPKRALALSSLHAMADMGKLPGIMPVPDSIN